MAGTCRRLSVNIEVRSSNIRQQVTEGDDMLKLNDAERKVLSQRKRSLLQLHTLPSRSRHW